MIILMVLAVLLLIIAIPVIIVLGGGLIVFGWLFLDIAVFVLVVWLATKLTKKK